MSRPWKRRKGSVSASGTPHVQPLEKRALMSAAVPAVDLASLPAGAFDASRILVRFRDGAPGVEGDRVLPGTAVGRAVGLDRNLREVQLGRGVGVEAALAAYRKNPLVEYAEPNWINQAQAVSNDPSYADGSLWGMYGDASTPANAFGSGAAEAWAKAVDAGTQSFIGSKDVYVGIIDEGVDISHPDLAGNVWTNPFDPVDGVDNDGNGYKDDHHGWDFVSENNSVYDGSSDDHGTHVAGTIAAKGGNGVGVAGVNWDVTYIPAKFLGLNGGATTDAIEALDYFTDLKTRHGLNIVATNNSWGGAPYSQALSDAITRSAKADILFVAAAGNGGSDQVGDDNDVYASYPGNYDTTAGAGYDAVISVAAIDSAGGKATLSNYGASTVDLGAPGVNVLSTLPGNTYGYGTGTSMAAPHVTGAAALYAANHANVSALTIRNAILDAARVASAQTASLAGKTVTGGRLDVAGVLAQGAVPAAPSHLTAAATSSSQISLAWADNSGNEDGFRVERLNGATGAFEPVATVGRNVTGWSDAGLAADTTYTYRVRAYRGAEVSDATNTASATTNAAVAAPNAPSDLAATGATAGTISLAWRDNAGDETGFAVERSADGSTWARAGTVGADVTTFTDSGLASAATYHYRVRAYRGEPPVYSGYSNTLTAGTAALAGSGTGLRGDYYDNMLAESSSDPGAFSLSGWKFARTDAAVDFDWGTGAPPTPSKKVRMAADTFTVRWTGQVEARYTDNYYFRFVPDDGVGIWITVDGVRKSLWTPTWDRLDGQAGNGTSTEYANTSTYESAAVALKAGQRYAIDVVYYEYTGGATARLMWRTDTYQKAAEVIPQAQLYAATSTPPASGNTASGNTASGDGVFSSSPIGGGASDPFESDRDADGLADLLA